MKLLLIGISVLCLLYGKPAEKSFQLTNLEEIKNTWKRFGDTTAIYRVFGRNFTTEEGASSACGMGNSHHTNWTSYQFREYGVEFVFSKSVYGKISKNDEMEVVSQGESHGFFLDSTSNFKVYGLKMNRSTFKDLQKLKLEGKWVEQVDKDELHSFAFVTEYVQFYSRSFDKQTADSLDLNCENSKELTDYFSTCSIKKVWIADNTAYYKHVMRPW